MHDTNTDTEDAPTPPTLPTPLHPLRVWMNAQDVSVQDLVNRVWWDHGHRLSRQSVYAWMSGIWLPRDDMTDIIEEITGGTVTRRMFRDYLD